MDADLPGNPAGPDTLRYFTTEPAAYALALLLLMEYARMHPHADFVFGPMNMPALAAGGLVLSGPALAGPAAVLARVEGLAQHEPGAEEAVVARLTVVVCMTLAEAPSKEHGRAAAWADPAKVFDPRSHEVRPVRFPVAAGIMRAGHYTQSGGKVSALCFGLFDQDGSLRGAAIFGRPSGRLVAPSLWAGGNEENTAELTRLYADDDTGFNTESWFLSRCIRQLPRQIRLLVAYSAPDAGHHGGCYQAANWLYLGPGTGNCHYHYVDSAGNYVNKRRPWDYYAARPEIRSEAEAADLLGLVLVKEQPKHVYVLPRDRRAARALLRPVVPYPKPDL